MFRPAPLPVRLPLRFLSRDGNHKELIAGGEHNIIRDYFHSSAGFSLFTKATRRLSQLSLDYRFFILFLCAITLAPVCCFVVVGSCLYMDHVPVKSYSHTASQSGFGAHEFLKMFLFPQIFISFPPPKKKEKKGKNRKILHFFSLESCENFARRYETKQSVGVKAA